MITAIATAAVYVEDQEKSVAFWTEQVGFTIHRTHQMGPQGSWIEVGPAGGVSCLVLYPRSMMADWAERKPSIVFTCDDINRTFEEMSGRGVHFSQPPQPMAWGPFAIFDDVDGNWYGLRQDAP
ncbi:MAG TPA: VOC family protein [Chloroflexota bacterium]|nr:VOC family protein [Chloroflexota bacterium]